ncbi:MAG TPA: hypothetical protein VGX46_19535 [Vicinamibacterales bacterium]|jgi:predicted dinucleotide-binding enzyme|nr:hypothetical protein [Vicinamibacterales bacterium]
MRIDILGSELMGGKLGTIFARVGHDVVFSYSHSQRKLKRLAWEARGHARAGTPREASECALAVAGGALVSSQRHVEAGWRPRQQSDHLMLAHDERQ